MAIAVATEIFVRASRWLVPIIRIEGYRTMPQQRRKSPRLYGYNYGLAGIYFVTICTHRFTHKFGQIFDGDMRLNSLGRLVADEWQRTAILRTAVELDLFVVMPNHIHGLICITDHMSNGLRAGPMPKRSNSLGAIIGQFKSVVTKRSSSLEPPPRLPIWKRNYHDHIVRNETDLDRIRSYIIANPPRWSEDRYYSRPA